MEDLSLPPAVNSRLQSLLHSFDFAFVVSDCSQPDMPIVFASSKFYEMTGYSADEVRATRGWPGKSATCCCCCAMFCMLLLQPVCSITHISLLLWFHAIYIQFILQLWPAVRLQVLGHNCRFLQGPETERRKVMEIRDAIREDRCCQVSNTFQQ
jgi:hypothetical protein